MGTINPFKKREGLYEAYYDNGKIGMACYYKNGKKEGLMTIWHSNGNVISECNYSNGKKEGICQIWDHENGQLLQESNYINDKENGVSKEWCTVDPLFEEVKYVNSHKINNYNTTNLKII